MNNNDEVLNYVRAFIDERIDRIRRLPDLNDLTNEEKVYWIERFSFAGQIVLTFASDCSNIMSAEEGKRIFMELNNATQRAKRKVTGSAL